MTQLEYNLNTKLPLRFKNGKFKIFCISDLHGIVNFDTRLIRDLEALLDKAQPDLLFVLGDIAWNDALASPDTLKEFLTAVFEPVEKRGIPWAQAYGNHDNAVVQTDFDQQSIYESFAHNVSKRGPDDIHGIGNYVLPVLAENSDDIVYNIWALDSHDSLWDFMREFKLGDVESKWDRQCVHPTCLHDWGSTYDTLNFDQLMWYYTSSKELEKHAGHRIPGLMGMHIAPQEYCIAYKNTAETYYEGTRRENVGCSPVNSGLFNCILDRGDVKTLVAGHDHINDFTGKWLGITMTYDAGLNYDGYCADDLRGGRMFEISEENPDEVITYMLRSKDVVSDYPGRELRKDDIK